MYLAFSKCIPKTLERPGVQENAEKKQADLLLDWLKVFLTSVSMQDIQD
jgi:hypothetical protein